MNVFTAEQTDNTQRVASTAYVRTAISNMLDSSAALDTLNELSILSTMMQTLQRQSITV